MPAWSAASSYVAHWRVTSSVGPSSWMNEPAFTVHAS